MIMNDIAKSVVIPYHSLVPNVLYSPSIHVLLFINLFIHLVEQYIWTPVSYSRWYERLRVYTDDSLPEGSHNLAVVCKMLSWRQDS